MTTWAGVFPSASELLAAWDAGRRVDLRPGFWDGTWAARGRGATSAVVDPFSGAQIGRLSHTSETGVSEAVTAARGALAEWARTEPAVRANLLDRIAETIRARQGELAAVVSREMGMPLAHAAEFQIDSAAEQFSQSATALRLALDQEPAGTAVVRRVPVGVVAAITPWNFPLYQLALKVAPALAAGCTVVVKPSELTPFNACLLVGVLESAGVPPGVFNLVLGGAEVGERLVLSDVDMVTFTGSTGAGRRVNQLAAQAFKRVSLELGGKSPNIVLPGADLQTAAADAVAEAFFNSGQTCSALTRLLVPRADLAAVGALLREAAVEYPLVDPRSDAAGLGPLISYQQRARVIDFVHQAVADGAEVVCGAGAVPVDAPSLGPYIQPTVLTNVRPDSEIAQEEVFGPVLVVIAYDDVVEAVRIANGTPYGLAAGVWGPSREDAVAVATRLRAGSVRINGGLFPPEAPFGGFGQSGLGREGGRFGLEEFLERQALLF